MEHLHDLNFERIARLCSICFDNDYDFCLEGCRDQFCIDCFSRYVHEIVKNSWGLATVDIKCPSCLLILEKSEWRRFVRPQVRDLFDKNNQPFKTLSRYCPSCAHRSLICQKLDCGGDLEQRRAQLSKVFQLISAFTTTDHVEALKLEYQEIDISEDEIFHLYKQIHETLLKPLAPSLNDISDRKNKQMIMTRSRSKRRRIESESRASSVDSVQSPPLTTENENLYLSLQQISLLLISLETNPSHWPDLQFLHLSLFPNITCVKCSTIFCFKCGDEQHAGYTCMENIHNIVTYASVYHQLNSTNLENISDDDDHEGGYYEFERSSRYDSETCTVSKIKEKTTTENGLVSTSADSICIVSEHIANLKWKLQNSKMCPRCHILIQRDDGCNKVDCTMCGYRFCWECKREWGEHCGFYSCANESSSSNAGHEINIPDRLTPPASPDKESNSKVPENGVPDISKIQSKLGLTSV